MSEDGNSSTQLLSGYSAVRTGAELFFWGAVLVVIGHLVYYQPEQGLRMAPHGRLGRFLVLVGACFLSGALRDSGLKYWVRFFVILCGAQALLMVGGWAAYYFHLLGDRFHEPSWMARGRCLELAMDSAVLSALILLLGKGGMVSKVGWGVGSVFYASLALGALLAPFVLAEDFWAGFAEWAAGEPAEPLILGIKVVLAMLALIVLVRTRRLLSGPMGRAAVAPPPPDGAR